MHFSKLDFENYVKDYFTKLAADLQGISKEICENTVDALRISSLIPRVNSDGTVDKRCSFGRKSMNDSSSFVTGAESVEEGHSTEDNCIEKTWETFHENEHKLLDLLKVSDDIQNSKSEKILAEEIDKFSVNSMRKYADAESPTSHVSVEYDSEYEIKKIELCYQVLIGRLWNYARCMRKMNDLMTNEGWQKWRSHARILGSFAVYYASLQMHRKKASGGYLSMLYMDNP